MWSDVHSVKRALRSLSKKFTPDELEEKKAELRRREKDGLFSLVFVRIRSTQYACHFGLSKILLSDLDSLKN